ncbi:MAG: thioredoxin domain-containing protein [Anaerolineae bacterium]|nr:thioredoxin domain-containing protein [Anaerolineae bacterium]
MRNSTWKRYVRTIVILLLGSVFLAETCAAQAKERAVVHIVYFTSAECPHCRAVFDEVLTPLQEEYDDQLQIKVVDISDSSSPGGLDATNYEMLVYAEKVLGVPPEAQGLPMAVVGSEALVGEDTIRERLACLVGDCLASGGAAWPDIPGLAEVDAGLTVVDPGTGLDPESEGDEICAPEDEVCAAPAPIWMAYFYEVGCQECSRAEYDIRYVEGQYPQVMVEEYNVQGDTALAEWLGARLGVLEEKRLATPALFVGDDYLIGPEITSEAVVALAEKYATGGAERVWDDFCLEEAEHGIVERFESFGVLTVAFAGLVDGLNPCAFATLCFFVSYLALSGRQGREVLTVGTAFTVGVFLAYLAVGLGFYQVLDLLGDLLTTLGRWVYGLTGLFCAVLAVFSFLDFLKARRSGIGDMALNLPHALRMRINAVIRKGRHSRAFVAGSFFTGVAVSFLELACTGQVYLPTIVFVVSQPEMRVRALLFLVLYNLLFILPLVVVFILAYYGTTSKQLTRFLERRGATIKLGMALLFAALAAWLLTSVVRG